MKANWCKTCGIFFIAPNTSGPGRPTCSPECDSVYFRESAKHRSAEWYTQHGAKRNAALRKTTVQRRKAKRESHRH